MPTSFSDTLDGLSSTLMLGEKHIRPAFLGYGDVRSTGWIPPQWPPPGHPTGADRPAGDGSIFNDDNAFFFTRICGRQVNAAGAITTQFPLAKGPNDNYLSAPTRLFGSYHPGVTQFALGDGSVRALQVNTSVHTLSFLGNKKDGTAVPGF